MLDTSDPRVSSREWYDELPEGRSWSSLWAGYIICGRCSGVRLARESCTACGDPPPDTEWTVVRLPDGREERIQATFMGAEGRYEDWIYLKMMEHEWRRPVLETDHFPGAAPATGPSPRASIVILFWSYFETRIERLLRAGLAATPERLKEDALRRYSTIGARLNDFYRVVFSSTYKDDLEQVGFGQMWSHIARVQDCRNKFAHGFPQAIDDGLVKETVHRLRDEHRAWIAVYNKRASRIRAGA